MLKKTCFLSGLSNRCGYLGEKDAVFAQIERMNGDLKETYWEGWGMAKKVYFVITIFMILAVLSGIPHLIDGIRARGMFRVNYGIVVFPTLIGIWSFCKYKKAK